MGSAMIGTSRPEAAIVLNVIEQWTPARLREVEVELRQYIA
jgi:hypothetical protein